MKKLWEKQICDKTITSSFSGSIKADSPVRVIHTFLFLHTGCHCFHPSHNPLYLFVSLGCLLFYTWHIHTSIRTDCLFRFAGRWSLLREADNTLDRSPVYHLTCMFLEREGNCRNANMGRNTTNSQRDDSNPGKKIRGPDLGLRNISQCSTERIYVAVNNGKTSPSILPTAWCIKSPGAFYQNLLWRAFQASADTLIPSFYTTPFGEEALFFSLHFQPNNNNVFRTLWRSSGVTLFDSRAAQTNRNLLKFDNSEAWRWCLVLYEAVTVCLNK